MPTNIVPGSDVFRWKDLDLHGKLQRVSDEFGHDIAVHRYLKRDGQQNERMGVKGRRCTIVIEFIGDDFRAEYQKFVQSVEDEPDGLMVHPLLGRFNATCHGGRSEFDITRAKNAIAVTCEFTQNEVDVKRRADASQGVSAKRQSQTAALDVLNTVIVAYTTAAALAETLAASAATFADAAENGYLYGTIDPGIGAKLEQVAIDSQAVADAVAADEDAATDDADRYDAINATEQVYARSVEIMDALDSARIEVVEYAVPADVSVALLAMQFYGSDGGSRIDEILANNPDIDGVGCIPSGTRLKMAAATV